MCWSMTAQFPAFICVTLSKAEGSRFFGFASE